MRRGPIVQRPSDSRLQVMIGFLQIKKKTIFKIKLDLKIPQYLNANKGSERVHKWGLPKRAGSNKPVVPYLKSIR
jgi:hypothetical protein